MSKRRKTPARQEVTGMRQAQRTAYVEALRDGRKERPATFQDRKRKASKDACRDRRYW